MYVVVYMVAAETVIALAAGAIAKLQLRMVHICSATYCTLMGIQLALLLPAYASGFPPEIDGALAGSGRPVAPEIAAAENEEVQHRHHRQQVYWESVRQNGIYKEHSVNYCQVFYLYRDNVKYQDLDIREHTGKAEKHGQIYIVRVQPHHHARSKVYHKTVNYGQDNAGEKVNSKLACTPVLLQSIAHPIVKIEYDESQNTGAGRVEHKGHQTPDLPSEYKGCIKAQIGEKQRVYGAENPECHIGYSNIQHKVLYAEIGMVVAKALNLVHRVSHTNLHSAAGLLILPYNIPRRSHKVYKIL